MSEYCHRVDLANDARLKYNVSRLRLFLVATGVDSKAVVTSDLGEARLIRSWSTGEARRRGALG